MKYKLIALDLDGTLKNTSNLITEKTKNILIKAQLDGVKVVLASGRPTPGLRHEAKELRMDEFGGYLLSFNGARVLDYKNKRDIYEKTLTLEEALAVSERAKQYNLARMTYEGDYIVTEDVEDEYVCTEARINDMTFKQVDNFDESLHDPIFKLLMTGKPEYLASIIDEFKEPFPTLSIYRSAPFFIEVMANKIDKAESLDRLVKEMGIMDRGKKIRNGTGP